VVTYIATVSKVAAVAVLCRLVSLTVSGPWPQALGSIQPVLMWLSVIAMTLGNLAALAQRDLKRLLGYSTVAHAGYILIGLQTFAASGLTSALFYALGYLGMSFVCFLVVCAVGDDQDLVTIDSLSGLHQRSPLLALTLLVGMFGLIGLPPTVGFVGKWFLFSAALERGQFFLVLVAAVNSVAALYYYLLVIRQAYLVDHQGEDATQSSLLVRLAAVVSMALVLGMGTFPGHFWELSARAVAALFT
jgi:NADH-quinone oxidoreductase subunit N